MTVERLAVRGDWVYSLGMVSIATPALLNLGHRCPDELCPLAKGL
jgi:hypothetical protein